MLSLANQVLGEAETLLVASRASLKRSCSGCVCRTRGGCEECRDASKIIEYIDSFLRKYCTATSFTKLKDENKQARKLLECWLVCVDDCHRNRNKLSGVCCATGGETEKFLKGGA